MNRSNSQDVVLPPLSLTRLPSTAPQNFSLREFYTSISKRKRVLDYLIENLADRDTTPEILKAKLFDLRQITLQLIDEALDVERRANEVTKPQVMKEVASSLYEIFTDVDFLFRSSKIHALLPPDFPTRRNPFVLGKSIDQLYILPVPKIEAKRGGDMEVQILEVLRYKRASKALLRSESVILNKLPLSLLDMDRLTSSISSDVNVEKIVRCVLALIQCDRTSDGDVLRPLREPSIVVEAHELLRDLNNYKGQKLVYVDFQETILDIMEDIPWSTLRQMRAVEFLVDWINDVLGQSDTANLPWALRSRKRKLIGQSARYINLGSTPISGSRSPTSGRSSPTRKDKSFSFDDSESKGKESNFPVIQNPQVLHKRKIESRVLPLDYPEEMRPQTIDALSGQASPLLGSRSINPSHRDSIPHNLMRTSKSDLKLKDYRVRRKGADDSDVGLTSFGDAKVDSESISAIRYELLKMQQELSRRKILHPKHYSAASIDKVVSEARIKALHGSPLIKKAPEPQAKSKDDEVVILFTKDIYVPIVSPEVYRRESVDAKYCLEFEYTVDNPFLEIYSSSGITAKIHRFEDWNMDTEEIIDSRELTPEELETLNIVRSKDLFYTMTVSRLIYNLTTGDILQDLVETADDELRKSKLKPFANQFEYFLLNECQHLETYDRDDIVVEKFIFKTDRSLYSTTIADDKGGIDIVATRNDDCTGVIVTCRPVAFSKSAATSAEAKNNAIVDVAANTVVIDVSDLEIGVLLINQRGLFKLSMVKWNCMQSVAEWIINRTKCQRVTIPATYMSRDILTDTASNDIRRSPGNVLQVSVDRSIDVHESIINQWKSRNIPSIKGMAATLSLKQEQNMLRLEVLLSFPPPNQRKQYIKRPEITLIDYRSYGGEKDEDQYAFDYLGGEKVKPVKLFYLLSEVEIMIFGSCGTVTESRIAFHDEIAGPKGIHNPLEFIWKLLCRLHVEFRGSLENPYHITSHIDDANQWGLNYDRRLYRDIRTISNHLMIITASSVGNQLLIESEPSESNSQVKVIESKLLTEREMHEIALMEGWDLTTIFRPISRASLASHIIDKLKVVTSDNKSKATLEHQAYAETRMLSIVLRKRATSAESPVGIIEITQHMTLNDLRTIIKYEIDTEKLPKLFCFVYRGFPCSIKQEAFRRPWVSLCHHYQ